MRHLALLALLLPLAASARPVVVPVIYAPYDETLPHPGHEGARITLKAVLREADCAAGYRVWWDTDLDRNFDDETSRTVTATAGTRTVYDLGRTFEIPDVPERTTMGFGVRVRDLCTHEEAYGTYHVEVFDWRPSPDPVQWTDEQARVQGSIALDEVLWYLHRSVNGRAGSGAAISGLLARVSNDQHRVVTSGLAIRAFADAGHLAAYAPGSIDAGGMALPVGWNDANDHRWAIDPYAETVTRLLNGVLLAGSTLTNQVQAADEAATCGFEPGGVERVCARVPGTVDGKGAYVGGVGEDVYRQGLYLGSMATLLPVLGGTPVQVGNFRGRPYEWVVQQMVDYLGAMQYDGGCASGGWLYSTPGGATGACDKSDASTSQWAYFGLEGADSVGQRSGVVVNNRHKYRVADNLALNQRLDGGAAYRTSSPTSNFQLTGGAIMGARWLGLHLMEPSEAKPFSPYSPRTAAVLRAAYDRYLSFTRTFWDDATRVGSVGWQDRLWQRGSYLCGNRNAVYGAPACGNTYAIYSHRRGYFTGNPVLERVGDVDWMRQFATYYSRAQARTLNNYSTFGRIADSFCDAHSVTCVVEPGSLTSVMAGLVLAPVKFKRAPMAVATVRPDTVVEGCAGGGRVSFDVAASFHRDPRAEIVRYQWDFDDGDGLWWETGRAPDADSSEPVIAEHVYMREGTYTATLRILDDATPPLSDVKRLTVRVEPSAPQAPSAACGGPYTVEVGGGLQLAGSVDDPNAGCGDRVTAVWDLDGDGAFDDASGATAAVPWEALAGLPVGQPVTLAMRATDESGRVDESSTTLTLFPAAPVAAVDASPRHAAPGQEVRFDGRASYTPNPDRRIVSYLWDFEGDGAFDGGGAEPTFRHTYERFGTFEATVRVTDDRGRTDDETVTVAVDRGDHPPTARIAGPEGVVREIVLVEGDALRLDGSLSSDPDVRFGDRVAEHAWDTDGDGQIDAAGPQVLVPWVDLRDEVQWPGRFTVTLRVTDTLGASDTETVVVHVVRGTPDAIVAQTPDPAPVRLDDGSTVATLDARGSDSPVRGQRIVRVDWDLDDDGTFEAQDRPVVDYREVFSPIPTPETLPEVFVRVRVYDEAGRVGEERLQIRLDVPPTPPTADADPTEPPERGYHLVIGEGVTLDAGASSDPDSEIYGDFLEVFRWDVNGDPAAPTWDYELVDGDGDGAEAQLELTAEDLAEHGITEPGTYTLVLQVQDSMGLTAEDTVTLTVHPAAPVAEIVAPETAAPGRPVVLDGSGSDHPHPDRAIVRWAWDLDGDGEYDDAEGAVVEHTFPEYSFEGPFHVGLQVTDEEGATATTTFDVTVNEGQRPPAADAGGPYATAVGSPVVLDASGSSDPDAAYGDAIVHYGWDLDGDGEDDVTSDGPGPVVVPWQTLVGAGVSEPGRHLVTVRVTDRAGEVSTATAPLVIGANPMAVIEARPDVVRLGQVVTLDAGGSRPGGPGDAFHLVRYVWDTDGDGQHDDAEGPVIEHRVTTPDSYTAAVRVIDRRGGESTALITLDVVFDDSPPVARAGGPYATGFVGGAPVEVVLDGRGSFDPDEPYDRIVRYEWDVDGDGDFGDLTGAVVAHRDPAWRPGLDQTIALRVCDVHGQCSAASRTTVVVRDEAPPSGEIVSPRDGALECIGADGADVIVQVSDPEGESVTATLLIDGRPAGQALVQTRADGGRVEARLRIDGTAVGEGEHTISVRLDDGRGGVQTIHAGRSITFDRTAPRITIAGPEDVCYAANAEPQARVTVDDALDGDPAVRRSISADACRRTLEVTATDACGNTATSSASWRVAQPVDLAIEGAAQSELIGRGEALSWRADVPDECLAGAPAATIQRDGGARVIYVAGTPIDEPGAYTLRVEARPCAGAGTEVVFRGFQVNAPPVAVALPAGTNAYTVTEGQPVRLDGRLSRSPESGDSIVRYEWDIDGDGDIDAEGPTPTIPTTRDGRLQGRLVVTDEHGDQAAAPFTIEVRDAVPVADPGGPYAGVQGRAARFDGSNSRAGSETDPVREYEWSFGDGTTARGPDLVRPEHTYAEDGNYDVRLTVHDQDGSATAITRIAVSDVHPVITPVASPEDPYEIAVLRFAVEARAGAPADPVVRYSWFLDGDEANPIARGADVREVLRRFRDANGYRLSVRVWDDDSSALYTFTPDVREITLRELVEELRLQVERVRTASAGDAFVIDELDLPGDDRRIEDVLAEALWGERHARRGNTLLALDHASLAMAFAQMEGADFDVLPWALGRQLVREQAALRLDYVQRPRVGPEHPAVRRADQIAQSLRRTFNDPQFERDVNGRQPLRLRPMLADAQTAYFHLTDAIDPCSEFGAYALDDSWTDPVERVRQANEVNGRLAVGLQGMIGSLVAYRDDAANEEDPGPAKDQVEDAIHVSRRILGYVQQPIGIVCQQGSCITDRDALEMELQAMDLVGDLTDASETGAWSRNWQACLVRALAFRIELSALRVEYVCGETHPLSLMVRDQQAVGMQHADAGRFEAALEFYARPQQRCLAVTAYNECLSTAFPQDNPRAPVPAECQDR